MSLEQDDFWVPEWVYTAGSKLDCPKLLYVAFSVALQQNDRDRNEEDR